LAFDDLEIQIGGSLAFQDRALLSFDVREVEAKELHQERALIFRRHAHERERVKRDFPDQSV
jgi:hypothetical protein